MTRTAILGGETGRRGILGGQRSKLESRLLLASLAAAVIIWMTVGGLLGVFMGVLLYGMTYALTWRLPVGRSAGSMLLAEWRWWRRSRRRLTEFVPAVEEGATRVEVAPTEMRKGVHDRKKPVPKKGKAERRVPDRSVPDAVGRVRLLAYEPEGGGALAVLLHHNPGQEHYLSAVLEVEGQPSGLREEEDYSAAGERFGRLLASCGGPSSLTSGVQLINRVVPIDPAVHEWFLVRNRSQTAPRQLFESYAELIDRARQNTEQHRNFVVARIPLGGAFADLAREFGSPADDNVRGRVVHNEMSRLASLCAGADLRPVRLLGPKRLAALLRSLQDPSYYIDDLDNVDMDTCWQRTSAKRGYLLVNDTWATRVARVAPEAVTPEPVHMRWLAPMLVDVQPSVVRTVSVLITLESARKARAEARRDVAEDRGRVGAAAQDGMVTDGSDEAQMTSSQQRLRDLRPGSGHTGARWGMYVSLSAPEKSLRRASDLITERAGDSGLAGLDWMDGAHDLAQPFVWPMWRGLHKE
jgi:hypothetical protein